ncbi:MAG: metal-sensitive transcriptional regulator [Candidatus Latescibacterota bacterium]|nr:metal-sensitive transcriptional regulator [Candidatus Latescibacterota bacterium]
MENGVDRHVYQPDKAQLQKRLRRIGGQVQGITRMIEQDRYCVDILVQLSAARAALDRVALRLLESHTKGCVRQAIEEGEGEQAVEELVDVIGRFTR